MWMATSYYAGPCGICFGLLLLLSLLMPVTMYGSWVPHTIHLQMELATMANAITGSARSQLLNSGCALVTWPTWNLANWGS
jgi:hypothetical protein